MNGTTRLAQLEEFTQRAVDRGAAVDPDVVAALETVQNARADVQNMLNGGPTPDLNGVVTALEKIEGAGIQASI
jgi:hypothetical protein